MNGGSARQARTAWFWRNRAARLVVGRADDRVHGLRRVYRVCHVGGVPERALHLRPVSVSVLLARAVWRFTPRVVWTKARMVAGTCAILAGAADFAVPGSLPLHLLLLPRRLLQGVLGGSDLVHGRRTTQILLGREDTPADPAERASLCCLHRVPLSADPVLRCVARAVVPQSNDGPDPVRHRRRHAGPRRERRAPLKLYPGLSLHSSRGRRREGRSLAVVTAVRLLQLLERPQRAAHALCLDESVLSRALRRVHPLVLDGHPN